MHYPFPPLSACFPEEAAHPFLFFSADDLEALRRRCRAGDVAGEYVRIREGVEEAIQEGGVPPSPRRDLCRYGGEFEVWIRADQRSKCLVSNAALVALVEDDPEPAQRTYELAHAFMAWPSWVHPQLPWMSVDLRSSASLMTMAIVYDFLYDRLTDNQRMEIESVCWWRGLSHLAEDFQRENWATSYKSNWCAVCCAGVGIAALAFAASGHLERSRYLDLAEQCARATWRYLDAYGAGGAWWEGVTYWEYGTGLALTLAHALRSVTGGEVDLFQHPKMAEIGEFPLRAFLPPDRLINFGDCYAHPWLTPAHLKLAREQKDGRHLWFFINQQLYYRTNQLDIFRVLWWPEDVDAVPVGFAQPSVHFPEIGWVIFRDDGADPETLIAPVKIGTTLEPHGHPDVGTFLMHYGGVPLIREFGMPRYGDPAAASFRETCGHNLPLFDGRGQLRDRPRAGRVEEIDLGGRTERLVADLTEPYGYGPLTRFTRIFTFSRPDTLTVEDRFEVCRPVTVRSQFHYEGRADVEGRRAHVQNGPVGLDVEVVSARDLQVLMGEYAGLVPNKLESPEPITIRHLAVVTEVAPPGASITCVFKVCRQ